MLNWRFALRPRAIANELEGDPMAARTDMIEGIEISKRYESLQHLAWFEVYAGLCDLELGLIQGAQSHYEDGVKLLSTLGPNFGNFPDATMHFTILRAELLAANGDIGQSDKVFDELIRSDLEGTCSHCYKDVVCRSRYGMSLARRGMRERATIQFDEAMKAAKRIGCEKRVQLHAQHVGIVVDVNTI